MIIFLIALSSAPFCLADEKVTPMREAQGYNALEHVLGKQKSLDKLLLIKRPSEGIKNLMKEISHLSGQADSEIKIWQKGNPAIVAKDDGFPSIEEKSRANIESGISKDLILSGGTGFEMRLLVSQLQATDYVVHTIEALEDQESSAFRKDELDHYKKKFQLFHDQAFALLTRSPLRNTP